MTSDRYDVEELASRWPHPLWRQCRTRTPHAHISRVALIWIASLVLWLNVTIPAAAQWYWQHPQPTANDLLDVEFVDANTGMAVGRRGTVLRTDDGGDTWSPRADVWGPTDRGTVADVSLIDTSTATIVGVVGKFNLGFIARTGDGGSTWVTQFNGEGMAISDVSFVNADVGAAVGTELEPTTQALHPVILRTTDAGTTWSRQAQINGTSLAVLEGIELIDQDLGVAVGASADPFGAIILRTTDGGATWDSQLLDQSISEFFDVAFPEPDTGFVVGDDGAILKSVDGGVTWIPQVSGTEHSIQSISCSDADTCVVVAAEQILHTTDGGNTWTPAVVEDGVSGLWSVFVLPGSSGAVAVGQDGAILKSDDGAGQWMRGSTRKKILEDVALNDVSFTDVATGVAVGGRRTGLDGDIGDGVIVRTLDGGNTWLGPSSVPPVLEAVTLENIFCADSGGCTTVGSSGAILRSTDYGQTWVSQASGTTLRLRGVYFSDPITGTVVGGHCSLGSGCDGVILGTENGGDSWEDRTPEDYAEFVLEDVFFTNSTIGTVVGAGGTILHTTDGGATWVAQMSGTDANLMAVHFTSATKGFVVGDGPSLLRTTDGGLQWEDVTLSDLPVGTGLVDIDFADADNGIAVGTAPSDRESDVAGNVILRTSDGGESWVMESGDAVRAGVLLGVDLPLAHVGTVVGGDNTLNPSQSGVVLRTVGVPTFPLHLVPASTYGCLPSSSSDEVFVDVYVGSVGGYGGAVQLSTSGESAGISSAVVPSSVAAPGGAMWTVLVDPSALPGRHVLSLTADDGTQDQVVNLLLDVVDPSVIPALDVPGDGEADIDLRPTFTWSSIVGVNTYRVQVATDVDFADVVIDEEVAATSFVPEEPLSSDTEYFWRVAGVHECAGSWSEVFSFRTRVQPVVELAPEAFELELAPGETGGGDLTIANLGTGDLVWSLATAQPPSAEDEFFDEKDQRTRRTSRKNTGSRAAESGRKAANWVSRMAPSLPSVVPIPSDGDVVDCENESGIIVHDDGTVEGAYSAFPPVDNVVFVDRFTPTAYPGKFTAVCVAFVSQQPESLDFEIVVFDDDGADGEPGTELAALAVSADDIPQGPPIPQTPTWFGFDISSLGLVVNSGSVYIGARWTPSDPNFFIAVDESPENPPGHAGGYVWDAAGGEWRPLEGVLSEYRALFVRGVEDVSGCGAPSNVPWLNVEPNGGTTPAGGSSEVHVSIDAADLPPGQYRASVCILSNDPIRPVLGVPVILTVLGADLAFNPQSVDFGDVEAGHTSPAYVVALHSVGALDATGVEFQLVGDGFEVDTGACDTTLPVGDQCEVGVTFTPPGVGPFSAALEAHSDDGAIATVSLSGRGVSETGVFTPMGLAVDTESIISDANGVFEPGELAPVTPIWRNDGLFAQSLEGVVSDLTGPEGPTYSLLVAGANYGEVEAGETAICEEGHPCYEMDIGPVGVPRPTPHWDAAFEEVLSDETTHTWTLHLGESFTDVPRSNLFYSAVEASLHSGVTGGCTDAEYCPAGTNSRNQMAVFLLRAVDGGESVPPACVKGQERFADVPAGSTFCPWIEELARRGVTSGCGDGNYCPGDSVTRAQMAVFLLKAVEGEGYTPPECTRDFTDVPCPSIFAAWIEELSARGITGGCDGSNYCPNDPVTRGQMAVFVTRTFDLALYGP